MFRSGLRFLSPVVMTYAFAAFSTCALAQNFTPACSNPSKPGKATGIDSRCPLEGSGGDEAAQNEVKNNFCAAGTPTSTSFDEFKSLQASVEQNKAINFGDQGNHGMHGPTTDRAPLTALGEGKLVQLVAYVVAANQEGAESVNCKTAFDTETNKNLFHDIHISLVETKQLAAPANTAEKNADECQGIVAEMTPHFRPPEWTAVNVNKVAAAHLKVRVTGQRFFDSSHMPCAAGKEVRSNPRRISLWEIHPIYKFELCTAADCDTTPTWVTLEDWVKRKSEAGAAGNPNP
jgi:hypothetical protein